MSSASSASPSIPDDKKDEEKENIEEIEDFTSEYNGLHKIMRATYMLIFVIS